MESTSHDLHMVFYPYITCYTLIVTNLNVQYTFKKNPNLT